MSAQKWMLPLEAISALAIIGGLGYAFRFGVKEFQKFENDGKPKRFGVDVWDRRMMERDSRLTGNVNVQSDACIAPEAFKTNSAWELERPWI